MADIILSEAKKTYPSFELGPINLDIKTGEFFGIFGPPSSGKTSILRMILGLLDADSGVVSIGGRNSIDMKVDERNLSMVFQNLALFPHMSGKENITFPLTEKNVSEVEIKQRLDSVAQVLHIEHILHKNPSQMSGGERQRIALGRAFITDSEAMLLDEPIAALDARLREEMRVELKRLQREKKQTFVYVSHDEEEVLAISDRVAIVIDGQIAQVGTPSEIYDSPNSISVGGVVGSPPMNFFSGKVSGQDDQFVCDKFNIQFLSAISKQDDPSITLGVRPEDLWATDKLEDNGFTVDVTSSEPLGSYTVVNAKLDNQDLKIRLQGQQVMSMGDKMHVKVDQRKMHLFDINGNRI
jgi:ABC-type sugar transport system ATPase subunit